jgi:hypothetical protein
LAAPAAVQGSFLPVGEAFTAVTALTKIFETAATSILIVDPYADQTLLAQFAVLAPEKVQMMILADEAYHKPGLKPAAQAWTQQFGPSRPMEVRVTLPKTLHDRIIVVDERDVWTLGQSFNALAKRAPTSLVLVMDADTATLKIDAYKLLWAAASPV